MQNSSSSSQFSPFPHKKFTPANVSLLALATVKNISLPPSLSLCLTGVPLPTNLVILAISFHHLSCSLSLRQASRTVRCSHHKTPSPADKTTDGKEPMLPPKELSKSVQVLWMKTMKIHRTVIIRIRKKPYTLSKSKMKRTPS